MTGELARSQRAPKSGSICHRRPRLVQCTHHVRGTPHDSVPYGRRCRLPMTIFACAMLALVVRAGAKAADEGQGADGPAQHRVYSVRRSVAHRHRFFGQRADAHAAHRPHCARGARLTGAFVTTPVCSPSRAALVASRYSSELGILDWINPKDEPDHGLATDLVTWMELLQQAGYRTGLFGKWHLGTAERFHPKLRGYDEFVGFRDGGRPPKDAILEIDGQDEKTNGFIVDVVTDHALEFLGAERRAAVSVVAALPRAALGLAAGARRRLPPLRATGRETARAGLSEPEQAQGRADDARILRQYRQHRPQRGARAGCPHPAVADAEHDRHLYQRPRLQHRAPRHLVQRQRAVADHRAAPLALCQHSASAATEHVRPGAARAGRRALAGAHQGRQRRAADDFDSSTGIPTLLAMAGVDTSPRRSTSAAATPGRCWPARPGLGQRPVCRVQHAPRRHDRHARPGARPTGSWFSTSPTPGARNCTI